MAKIINKTFSFQNYIVLYSNKDKTKLVSTFYVHYPENPFILKNVIASRYSPDERMRIRRIEQRHNFTLFHDLGIDESKGDRLLRYCIIE